jgi:hypothetical protein
VYVAYDAGYMYSLDRATLALTELVILGPPGDMLAPRGLRVDPLTGLVYIADAGAHVVWRMDPVALLKTVAAGQYGTVGRGADGVAATASALHSPSDVAVLGRTLFIVDNGNFLIRAVNLDTGVINTIAGTGDWPYSGDGHPPLSTNINPGQIAIEPGTGALIFNDWANNYIHRLYQGTITTIAGMACSVGVTYFPR